MSGVCSCCGMVRDNLNDDGLCEDCCGIYLSPSVSFSNIIYLDKATGFDYPYKNSGWCVA